MDPTGNQFVGAKGITDSLFRNGCIVGAYPSRQTEDITANPVFDAARRFSRFYRIARRQELVSYEVDADGARLRFKRRANGISGADAWAGIAPPPNAIPSGELVTGEEYLVRGTTGGVSHGLHRYFVGDKFTAAGPHWASDGDAEPWQYDGIRHTALKKGWTNEWVIVLQTHVFKEAFDSLWKPSVYADFFGWGERALTMLPSADPALVRHCNTTTAFSVDPTDGRGTFEQELTRAQFINPEAPSAYRYTMGVNLTASTEFRKSCPIYERPMEIWSCTLEFTNPKWQTVVVHLRDRPRKHANAPATVDADPAAWSADDKARLDGTHATDPEDYRTPDNALREWLRWAFGDGKAPSLKTGDHAYAATPYPVPWGSVVPTFHLVKLIPEAYEDDNETWDTSDSRMLAETYQQAEWYLRAMCEGYVDGQTTAERTCRNASDAGLYEFTWENVCFQSHQGRDIGPFPVSVRDDRPAGFGPLPNTRIYADVHNRLAGVVNLLTKLRVDVPLEWQTRTLDYVGKKGLDLDPLTYGYCTDATYDIALDNQKPPTAATLSADSGWVTEVGAVVIQGTQSAGFDCSDLYASQWDVANFRRDTQWTVAIQSGWEDAVPTEIQDLISVGAIGTIAERQELRQRSKRVDEDPRTTCDGVPSAWQWQEVADIDNVTTCVVVYPGTVSAPAPPSSDFGHQRFAGGDICGRGSIHSITWGLLAFPGAFVEVPLVDLP